jgi:hypothetical protein
MMVCMRKTSKGNYAYKPRVALYMFGINLRDRHRLSVELDFAQNFENVSKCLST